MGQVTRGPVDYPFEEEKRQAEQEAEKESTPEPEEEVSHGPETRVDSES